MKHSEVTAWFAGKAAAYTEFPVLLAEPGRTGGDGVDVLLAGLRGFEIDHDEARIVLYSSHTRAVGQLTLSVFGMFADVWPVRLALRDDYEVFIALPLGVSGAGGPKAARVVPLAGMLVGEVSQEIWFLTDPVESYPEGSLPA